MAIVCPLELVSLTSAAWNVVSATARSKVTRTLFSVFADGPLDTEEAMRGGVIDATSATPTAAPALTRPPVMVLPANAGTLSTVLVTCRITWLYVQVGWALHT